MAACARAIQQQDGSFLLGLDPAATDLTACAFVVESGSEYGNSLLSLSAQDGGLLSGAIISCWAAAFGIRAIISIIRSSENE